jgi:hypothetical protein
MKAPRVEMLASLARGAAEPVVRAPEGFDAALQAVRAERGGGEAAPRRDAGASRARGEPDSRGHDRAGRPAPRGRGGEGDEVSREDARHGGGREGRVAAPSERRGEPAARARRPGRLGLRSDSEVDSSAAVNAVAAASLGGAGGPRGVDGMRPVAGAPVGSAVVGLPLGGAALADVLLGAGLPAVPPNGIGDGVRVHAAFKAGGVSTLAASDAPHPEVAGAATPSLRAQVPAAAWTGEVAERLLEAVADTALRQGEAGLSALLDAPAPTESPLAGVGVAGGGAPLPPQEGLPVAIEAVLASEPDEDALLDDSGEEGGMPWVAGAPVRSEGGGRAQGVPAAPSGSVEAPEVPELAVRLPDRLHLGVVDRGGAWRADIERHVLPTGAQGLDVLLRGDAAFVADVRGAQGEMRRALEVHDARLLSFDVRADAGAGQGREGRGSPGEAPEARPAAGRRGRAGTPSVTSTATTRAGRIDRLA